MQGHQLGERRLVFGTIQWLDSGFTQNAEMSDNSGSARRSMLDSSDKMTHFTNYDRVFNQAATQHFYGPVSLLVLMTVVSQQDAANPSS